VTRPKFLFDENFGLPAIQRLRTFLSASADEESFPEIRHVLEYHDSGARDIEWIPKMAEEGWIVISADRGKKSSGGEKLPKICVQYGITHVLLSASVHHRPTFDKMMTVLSVWADLSELNSAPL
jgi:hypothetical protein